MMLQEITNSSLAFGSQAMPTRPFGTGIAWNYPSATMCQESSRDDRDCTCLPARSMAWTWQRRSLLFCLVGCTTLAIFPILVQMGSLLIQDCPWVGATSSWISFRPGLHQAGLMIRHCLPKRRPAAGEQAISFWQGRTGLGSR